ncbi:MULTISPECIES: M23 family metallopeptidase [Bacillaceae]|uniref:Peptidase M23 n=1 Tax=Domibacillus aminovorans TaxID=29332 RepID=A0A177L108_9BACI|nr:MULTISPECIES: M23 family metallopeptidase [Bacillaceae]OAH58451.1 peptidase M23 [Domibacillus aminovorans]
MHRSFLLLPSLIAFIFLFTSVVLAEEQPTREEQLNARMGYYIKYESIMLPWYYLAAVDQFERNIQQVRTDIPEKEGVIAIQFSDEVWAGMLNPNKEDTVPRSITFFNGKGRDGNQDGIADPDNDDDVMYTMAAYLSEYGHTEKNVKKALMDYYGRKQTVNQIMTIAKIYQHFQKIHLDEHAFPVPVEHNFSYRGTWGASRGWGGRRIHEGTDLFADYGVPVRATSYGIVEIKGWNKYGGWRIGIRDIHNTYHYFAHLAYFSKEIKKGDIVKPGDVIGYVGSSGYGKKGTSGQFPPHLHYGMYKDNGRNEWAFDPYPSLKLWEKQEREARK